MKRISSILLFAVICLAFASCSKEDGDSPKASGKIIFNYNSNAQGIKKTIGQNLKDSTASANNPAAIIISIVDELGNAVSTLEEVPLYNMNGSYISKPISLEQGNYELTDFLVIDKDGNVLYIAPKEGSDMAYLVLNPLPIEFAVSKDQVTNVNVEVLENTGETPEEFGYTSFSFSVVDVLSFYLGVFIASDSNQSFLLTNFQLEIYKDSSKIFENLLPATTNKILLRNEEGYYKLVIKKNGYQTYEVSLTLLDLLEYTANNPLIIILSKADIPVVDGLVAYYPFNGNMLDISPNHFDGIGNASLTEDRFGNSNRAYHFNEVDQYIDLPNDSLLKPQFPFTISLWVYCEKYAASNQIITTDFKDDVYTGVWIVIGYTGKVILNYGNGNYVSLDSRRSKAGNTDLQVNRWYHITAEFISASQMEIFVNGINDGGVYTGYASTMVYSNNPGSIGRKDINSTVPPYYFAGSIDEVAIYNRALSQSEIFSLVNFK